MNLFDSLQGNPFIRILLIACIWDLFLGILRALKEKQINSSAGINGIIRKVGMIGSALFLKLVDLVVDFNLVSFLPNDFLEIIKIDSIGVCELFCLCFIAFEVLSAMKNLTRSNIPIPYKLKEFIEYMLDTFTTENNKKRKDGCLIMKNNRLDETKIGNAKVIVDIVPKGHCIPNVKIAPTTITIHNTGNNNASAKNNHNYMKNINKSGERTASWHFTVDDIEIYQSQSTNFKCYHAGTTAGNNTSIGIEICQFTDAKKQLKAYENAIELVKILLKYHNFTIDKVVQHNKWSGKDCPQLLRANKFGYNWDWFIKQCKGSTNQVSSTATFKNGDYTGKKAKVTATSLNVRYDRGTQYDVIGKLNKGDTVKLNYHLNGWVSIEGYKGNKGLGYISTDYLELL